MDSRFSNILVFWRKGEMGDAATEYLLIKKKLRGFRLV